MISLSIMNKSRFFVDENLHFFENFFKICLKPHFATFLNNSSLKEKKEVAVSNHLFLLR
tara:strand:+ start:59593 stop:59769 length:177 start_codon:yes stop_codon:yes gene_type:complete